MAIAVLALSWFSANLAAFYVAWKRALAQKTLALAEFKSDTSLRLRGKRFACAMRQKGLGLDHWANWNQSFVGETLSAGLGAVFRVM